MLQGQLRSEVGAWLALNRHQVEDDWEGCDSNGNTVTWEQYLEEQAKATARGGALELIVAAHRWKTTIYVIAERWPDEGYEFRPKDTPRYCIVLWWDYKHYQYLIPKKGRSRRSTTTRRLWRAAPLRLSRDYEGEDDQEHRRQRVVRRQAVSPSRATKARKCRRG